LPITNGASATLIIVATVTQVGTITNTATISAADQPDPNSANDTAGASIGGQEADLAVTKVVSNLTPNVGTNVTYTVQVTNNGLSDATGVVVSDLLPAGLTYVSSAPSQGTYVSGTGLWSVGALINGASATLTIVATVTQPVLISNTAAVSASDQPDPNSANNSASATLIGQQADLSITKSVNSAAPNIGTNITYTIRVTNGGPSSATGVVISDLLPAGLTYVSNTASQGTYTSGTGLWSVDTLANGTSATLTIVATVTQAGTITNTATVSAANQPDPDNSNNTASVSLGGQAADLAVTKQVDRTTPNVGTNVTYTIQVTNNGASGATGVVVSDLLPTGLTYVSNTASQGTYTSGTGIWMVGTLANGVSATLTIIATVTQIGSITNTATISAADQPDPNLANNTDSIAIGTPIADLSVTKAVNNLNPTIGGQITYTVTVHNSGPDSATGVMVTDQLPVGLTYVSDTPSQGAYTSTTGVWIVGTLANGASATLQLRVIVSAAGAIVNTAQVIAADQFDPNSTPGNNNPGENDQGIAGIAVGPTAISLASFVALPLDQSISVRWTTGVEVHTWGFALYRSADGTRSHAVRVTPELVMALGHGQGASYEWIDTGIVPGVPYRYWLQEVEINGATNEYGPVTVLSTTASSTYQITLPLVIR